MLTGSSGDAGSINSSACSGWNNFASDIVFLSLPFSLTSSPQAEYLSDGVDRCGDVD